MNTSNASENDHQLAGRLKKAVIPITIIAFALIFVIRCGSILRAFPEQEISLETVYGEEDGNLTSLERTGLTLRASSTTPDITFSFPGRIAVRTVEFDVRNLSRTNCRSYIRLDGSYQQSSTVMADGRNYVEFEEADSAILSDGLSMLPVTVRGVSFDLVQFVINPHGHLIFLELQKVLLVLAVTVLFEAFLLVLLAERGSSSDALSHAGDSEHSTPSDVGQPEDNISSDVGQPEDSAFSHADHAGRQKKEGSHPSLPAAAVLLSLQGFLGVWFLYQFFTSDWSELQIIYHVLVLTAADVLGMLLHLPCRNGRKPELVPLRILLFSLFSFASLELLYSDMYHLDYVDSTILNLMIYAVPYAVLYAVFSGRKRHYGYLISMIWWLVIAMINHYYFEYRQQAFELADLSMAGTAKNVMGTYRLDITPDVIFVYAASALLIAGLLTEDHAALPSKPVWKRITGAAAGAACAVIVLCNLPYVNLWNTNIGTMHRGYMLSYLSFAKKHLEKPTPAGYSAEEAEAILTQFAVDSSSSGSGTGGQAGSGTGGQDGSGATGQKGSTDNQASDGTAASETGSASDVDIIVVMDEAFADLPSTYGFETNIDGLPYIHSLGGANVRKGWMMSSVFGGTTANTEYEFLTGNSTAFLGTGSVPYTQYINSDQESLARLLKNRGYSATAFHPFLASGYKRYKVYPLLGFDNFISSDDGLTYNSRIRTYISDSADYLNLEEIYENNAAASPDGAQFIFNVTMQNHGTYSTEVPAVDVTVEPVDEDLKSFAQLREYLSLAYASDSAFHELTDYFSKASRKTVILMFGDHQPGVNNDVLQAMNPAMYGDDASLVEKEKQYTVPWVLWANFDLPEDLPSPERISPNYLRSFLLEAAGVQPSAWDNFTASVRTQYPALNILGWYDAEGNVHDITTLDEEVQLLDYKKIAYYNLFDHGKVKMDLFD